VRFALGLAIALGLLTAWPPAAGQAREGEVTLMLLDVGYNSAYRNGSWAPVDVLVENERSDIKGYLEVRSYSGTGQVQSPVYRIPVDSPKHSRKRFRAHCLLRDTVRVEATLYHKGRRVVEVPSYQTVRPVAPTDSMILVLDEYTGNFGFLMNALQNPAGDRRIHRHDLRTEQLAYLPGYAPCYSVFDFIIMSEIDPGRVSVRHRELLRQYVHAGGILVICVGEAANAYRGTWAEELMGATIGESLLVTEPEYARMVFLEEAATGAAQAQYSVATLEPALPDVLVRGETLVLATLRTLGSGAVVGLAVDGPSKALQGTPGFQDLWRDLAAMRRARSNLNYISAAHAIGQQLPWISGVRIQPKSTVMVYLGLYFLVGIVGNWLFWNRLKRREMAWVCLVVLSGLFTAYAVTFGTLGRAKNSEVSRIDVVEAPLAGTTAAFHSITGILTAGTAHYSGSLANDYALVTEAHQVNLQQGFGGGIGNWPPFTFTAGSPPRVENVRVGASELRLLHIEDQVPLAGTVEGMLYHDNTGVHGALVNRTGFTAPEAYLYYQGGLHRLSSTPGGWHVFIAPSLLQVGGDRRFSDALDRLNQTGGRWDHYGRSTDMQQFRDVITLALMTPQNPGVTGIPGFPGAMMGAVALDAARGPYLLAWVEGTAIEPLILDAAIPERMHETLLVADVAIAREDAHTDIRARLPVVADGRMRSRRQPLAGEPVYSLYVGAHSNFMITSPVSVFPDAHAFGAVEVEVFWESEPDFAVTCLVMEPDTNRFVPLQGSVRAAPEHGPLVQCASFVLHDWAQFHVAVTNQIQIAVHAEDASTDPIRGSGRRIGEVAVIASVVRKGQQTAGAWKPWPLSKPPS
jgi:hypothetical protein